jgi:hypothetical protein
MENDEEIRKLAGGSAGTAIGSIVGIMFVHQTFTRPLISSWNLALLLIAAVSAATSAAISFKVSLRLLTRRPHDALAIGAGIGACFGGGLYVLLTEVVKQLQQ